MELDTVRNQPAAWLVPLERQPLAIQVAERLRIEITNMRWASGQQLPNELELSKAFEVSRGTLREAVAMLVFIGIVVRRQGAGTFVI